MSGALHLWPHLSFLGRLEHFSRDWAALDRLLGTHMTPHDPRLGQHPTSRSPNRIRESTLQLLQDSPSFLRALCHLYLVDFTCLDYPLPAVCSDITLPHSLGCKNASILSAAIGSNVKQTGSGGNSAPMNKAKRLIEC